MLMLLSECFKFCTHTVCLRWKTKDPLAKIELSDQGLQTEPVKVLWCQGVTYRYV